MYTISTLTTVMALDWASIKGDEFAFKSSIIANGDGNGWASIDSGGDGWTCEILLEWLV